MAPVIKDSARHIWLAGLGALSMAGERGNKLFATLVKKGEVVDKANRARISHLKTRAKGLKDDAGAAMGKLARPMDSGVTTALHRLGVPTRKEILSLTKRVEDLTHAVEKSRRGKAPRRKTAATASA